MRQKFAACFNVFVTRFFFLILVVGLYANSSAQTIQYSRQNFRAPNYSSLQLVANIAGYHHILCFNQNQKIALFIYNGELQLQSKGELQIVLHEYDDVNIIPFKNFYFLYIHQPGSTRHHLWKISALGISTASSDSFARLIETGFARSTATLQLLNRDNELYIVGNTYYDQLEKIGTTVIKANESLLRITSHRVFFDFNKFVDGLKLVRLTGDDLLVLKTSKDSAGNLLQIVKVKLSSGETEMNSFNSGTHKYTNPTIIFDSKDSGIIVSSMIERTIFFTKLDYSLNEKIPVRLLSQQFNNSTAINFLLLPGQMQKWLSMHFYSRNFPVSTTRVFSESLGRMRYGSYPALDAYGNLPLNNSRYFSGLPTYFPPGSFYNDRYNTATAVRFTILNNNFSVSKDSLVANNKNYFSIELNQFSNAFVHNKNYLFLEQRFGAKRQGLLMAYANEHGGLATTDIRVYNRYEYMLSQLQTISNNAVILPYTYKRELGLVKITMD